MSDNKFRYYEVSTTSIVQANNMTDAEAIARGRKNIPGHVLGVGTETLRLSASEARERVSED